MGPGHITDQPWQIQMLIYMLMWGALCTTLFPFLYATRSRWWTTVFGRVILCYSATMAVAIDYTLYANLAYLYHLPISYWTQVWIQAGVFTFIALSSTALTVVLLTMQKKDREARDRDSINR